MIRDLREIGSINDAPVLLVLLDLMNKDWVGLSYKNNLGFLSICFWSARGDEGMSTSELLEEFAGEVAEALGDPAAQMATDALLDITYKQPPGWDRWLGGIPRPVRNFFDDVLHPRLKAVLGTSR